MILVKICGITNTEDALTAIDCGADMLGFVFAPGPRRISPEKAARIVKELPEITKIGVFVDENIEQVEEISRLCRLDFVQLHGSEPGEYARQLTVPFIKAFRARDEGVLKEIADFGADTFLLDSYDPHLKGGTGKTMNLAIAKKAARLGRMILAGGLTPDNVKEIIARIKPYAVDVSSGVELSPGKKDHDRIKKFIAEAKG